MPDKIFSFRSIIIKLKSEKIFAADLSFYLAKPGEPRMVQHKFQKGVIVYFKTYHKMIA